MQLHRSRVAGNTLPLVLALIALPCAISVWFNAVSRRVPGPYLDEVFHVGQAQTYCHGNFGHWDPKITTPPGVYIISYVVFKLTGLCDVDALRAVNAFCLLLIFFLLLHTSSPITPQSQKDAHSKRPNLILPLSMMCPQQVHSAFNVCLFPPLFFYCSLYYTDLASTFSVLLFWLHFLDIHSRTTPTFLQSTFSVMLALFALSFRQTNIFWVSVFPLGLLSINLVREKLDSGKQNDVVPVIKKSWNHGTLYDPQMRDAALEDYFFCAISLVIRAVHTLTTPARLRSIMRLLIPYIIVAAAFGGFVVWNGSVVLGDKSNHVATIHVPQMLYLWAYITFFSLPLTYPFIMEAIVDIVVGIPILTVMEPMLIFNRHKVVPRPLAVLFFFVGSTLAVRYNTIVHPFTLADNRHYTFYVFRILLQNPYIKYIAVPIYLICAWSVLESLGAPGKYCSVKEDEKADLQTYGANVKKTSGDIPSPEEKIVRLNTAAFGEGCSISFVLVWMVVSAMQLITAPLVEPRYFILPWIMWRLRVPLAHPGESLVERPTNNGWVEKQKKLQVQLERRSMNIKDLFDWAKKVLWTENDHRLWLETGWFLVINVVTGYIFLNWGFTWPQEPGKTQRFMW